MTEPIFIVIDLFCGAGGTTTGFEMTGGMARVVACVNHDPKAIKSHWLNHPDVKHFEEDIRTLDLRELVRVVNYWRAKYPSAIAVLWASLECTNFSKAKGGQPRDADSRTLADYLDRYVVALNPDYIQIENVVEFMSWGPLDEKGKPVSRKNGQDWMRWRKLICSHGYRDEWKEMNSANYGAYTSRNRLFGIFAKEGLPIVWPEPTHAKNPSRFSMHGDLQRWKAVKEVLDFADEGESIFNRKKALSDKTLERIYAGLIKYVAKGDTAFISKYYSGRPAGKVNSVENPSSTVRAALIQPEYFLDKHFGAAQNQSIEQPAGTIMPNDKHRLVESPTITANRKHHYIVNPSHGGHSTSTDAPCPVIVARQDKAPLYLVQTESGKVAIPVYEGDSEVMIKIKQFMVAYDLVDIKMRMLRMQELLKIQGFPEGYKLEGNQADQKKFIGNSVVPHVVKAWTLALGSRLIEEIKTKVA